MYFVCKLCVNCVVLLIAFSLSNIISTNCKYNEAGNQYVEVSLLRRDLEGLGVKSVNSLRLRENGPQCSYHHCRGHDRWMWRFNGSQCGSQLLVEDDRKIIANVVSHVVVLFTYLCCCILWQPASPPIYCYKFYN